MPSLYVARSVALGRWGSDVGVSKFLFKVGCTDEPPKPMVEAAAWGGETDWKLVKSAAAPAERAEAEMLARVARKETLVDPAYYPKLRGVGGVFKVSPDRVRNQMLIDRALSGQSLEAADLKPKPGDFAAYLIRLASE